MAGKKKRTWQEAWMHLFPEKPAEKQPVPKPITKEVKSTAGG